VRVGLGQGHYFRLRGKNIICIVCAMIAYTHGWQPTVMLGCDFSAFRIFSNDDTNHNTLNDPHNS